MMRLTAKPIALLLSSFITSGPLLAAEPTPAAPMEAGTDYAEATLTGDWGGGRTSLEKSGIVLEGLLRYDQLRNRGGASNGRRGIGHVDLKLSADLDALWGWKGTTAMINLVHDGDAGTNTRHTGSLMGTSNVEVGVPGTGRLFQAWVQQSFFDEQLAVLVGLYPVDTEFFGMESAGVFLGPQYGTPADLAQARNGSVSVFNNSAFGIRTKVQNADKSIYGMWALTDGVPNDPARPKKTAIRFAKGDGAFNIAEIGWLPQTGNDKYEGPAKLAVGIWGFTARIADQVDATQMRRSRGGYLLGEYTLLNFGTEKGRYLSGFARHTWGDGDSTSIKKTTNIGLNLQGPLASRPDDVLGLGFSQANLSEKWRTTQVNAGNTPASKETVLELTYRYALTPYFAIQPVAQRYQRPGGLATTPNASLLGVRLDLTL